MHRSIALLLFLISPAMYGMENNKFLTFFDLVKANIVSWVTQGPDKLSPMEALAIDKTKFEEEIQFPSPSVKNRFLASATGKPVERFSFYDRFHQCQLEFQSPHDFLTYWYYLQQHLGQEESTLERLATCSLFPTYRGFQVNGYSALGAVFLAKNVSVEDKCKFLELLMQYGFEWTEKDKSLIQLQFYGVIPAEQKMTMMYLLSMRQSNFAMLPDDIRRYILDCMMRSFKQKYGSLLDNY